MVGLFDRVPNPSSEESIHAELSFLSNLFLCSFCFPSVRETEASNVVQVCVEVERQQGSVGVTCRVDKETLLLFSFRTRVLSTIIVLN